MSSSQNAGSDMFAQAAQLFQSAMEAGIKIQEESTKSFTQMISGLGSPQQWQQQAQQAQQAWEKSVATAQENVMQAMAVMNENSQTSLELLEKAFAAQQATAAGDGQAKTQEMWETAMGAMRRNTEVLVQANNRLIESWQEVAKIMGGESGSQES